VPRLEAYVQDTTRTYTGLPAFNGNWGGTSSWYAREDSNLWPLAPEASALSAELRAQVVLYLIVPHLRDIHTYHERLRAKPGRSGIGVREAVTIGRLSRL
jgi:hypothetical protein